MTVSHSYINTRGVMYDSSNFPAQMCHLLVTIVIDCDKSSSMTPYETICQLLSRDGSVQKQYRLYQTMTMCCYLLQ